MGKDMVGEMGAMKEVLKVMKHSVIATLAAIASLAFVACGVGLPTPAADLPVQEAMPTATLTPTPTPAPEADAATHWAMVHFGAIVSDAHVQTLLDRHGAMPFKAYTVVGEFAGSSSSSGPIV